MTGDSRALARRLCFLGIAILTVTMAASALAAGQDQPRSERPKPPTVLFICPHGAAKSVLASAYFQRAAQERGLNVRVVAAGTDPQEAVSTVVRNHLEQTGYAVPVTKPRAVTKTDLAEADVVISMGCDLTSLPGKPRTLQRWDEVPAPSEDLTGADEAIRRRVIALVEELLASRAPRKS